MVQVLLVAVVQLHHEILEAGTEGTQHEPLQGHEQAAELFQNLLDCPGFQFLFQVKGMEGLRRFSAGIEMVFIYIGDIQKIRQRKKFHLLNLINLHLAQHTGLLLLFNTLPDIGHDPDDINVVRGREQRRLRRFYLISHESSPHWVCGGFTAITLAQGNRSSQPESDPVPGGSVG